MKVLVTGSAGFIGFHLCKRYLEEGFDPDITIVAEIAHMWTPQIAQAELQKWLSANTTQVDGFAVQSSGESGALNALESSGRPMVPMALGGEIGAFCYWRNNPDFIDRAVYAWPPGDDAEFGRARVPGNGKESSSFSFSQHLPASWSAAQQRVLRSPIGRLVSLIKHMVGVALEKSPSRVRKSSDSPDRLSNATFVALQGF